MVVTIFNPPVGGQFGPGFGCNWGSDFIGPLDPGWFWRWNFALASTPESVRFQGGQANDGTRNFSGQLATTTDERVIVPIPEAKDFEGMVFWVEVLELGIVVDQSSKISVQWNPQAGTQWSINERVGTSTTGGLTTEQALQLQTTTAAMGFVLGGGWSELAEQLLSTVGKRLINTELITPDREGEGRLTRPGGAFGVNAFGIQWHVFSLAPGIGLDEGVPDRTEFDHQQLSIMRDTSIGLMASESRYIASINGRWIWGLDAPEAVDYFIMPGVVVTYWWLLLFGGGLELANANAGA